MATATGEAPLTRIMRVRTAVPSGITVDLEPVIGTVGTDAALAGTTEVWTVTSVKYIPDAALSGVTTNGRQLVVVNRKADASGTTVIATLVLNTGVNLVQWVGKVITLSVVAGALDCNAGDVLTFQSTHTGTGITDPGGLVEVALSRA